MDELKPRTKNFLIKDGECWLLVLELLNCISNWIPPFRDEEFSLLFKKMYDLVDTKLDPNVDDCYDLDDFAVYANYKLIRSKLSNKKQP